MQTVLFDPGYSRCILGISENIEFMYGVFQASYMPIKQKKFQFSVMLPKIKETLNQNIAFYLGCLLWASYIKTIKGAAVEDNPCLNDEYNEENSTHDISYLIEFVTKILDKDSRYYISKPYETNPKHLEILKNYLEFIKLNKGFVKLKTTSDLILPKSLKPLDDASSKIVKEKIDEAIKNKKLSNLYEVYDYILE